MGDGMWNAIWAVLVEKMSMDAAFKVYKLKKTTLHKQIKSLKEKYPTYTGENVNEYTYESNYNVKPIFSKEEQKHTNWNYQFPLCSTCFYFTCHNSKERGWYIQNWKIIVCS